eukprot:TRINITY_DN14822_c1_g1_i1.p1 TRINITY_DN14822_c1_g1~~TRINITY_DN14822_c1_g1_i1.p1  ORF type:complete len:340 (-),score=41.75 TRINITY_DN14822_c1_g1_i1:77-1096(-)
MDYEPDAAEESLIDSSQERTAFRTRHLLIASRLAFAFSHGLLVVSGSVALGWEGDVSWYVVFAPAWFGDCVCMLLLISSCFASCPYIQCCLHERQARLGDTNPSILTNILPDIVMAILSFLFLLLAFLAELLLCWYLEAVRLGGNPALGPCASVFIVVSVITCCRGICISASGELFSFAGAAALLSSIASLSISGGPLGQHGWVLLLPWPLAVGGLLFCLTQRLGRAKQVLSPEEKRLRLGEQGVLAVVLVALSVSIITLAGMDESAESHRVSGTAGIVAGAGVAAVAVLRGRMALVESRISPISERLTVVAFCPQDGTSAGSSQVSFDGREVLPRRGI